MNTVLSPQQVLLRSFQEFRPNIRGSMIAPYWTKTQVIPGAISDDPLHVFGTSDEMINCASTILQTTGHPKPVLDPPAQALKRSVVIDRCKKSEDETEASYLVLGEQWLPLSSYRAVPLGRKLALLLKGSMEDPEFLQVTTSRQGIDVRLEQREWILFRAGPSEHIIDYELIVRDPLKHQIIFDGLDRNAPEGLSTYLNTALALASRLYASDIEHFQSGFELIGPNRHYWLAFQPWRQNPYASPPKLIDDNERLVPFAAESFPAGVWRLYNRSQAIDTFSITLAWTDEQLHLQIGYRPYQRSPGLRQVENLLAGAYNFISDDEQKLAQLEPTQLNDILIEQVAQNIADTHPNLALDTDN